MTPGASPVGFALAVSRGGAARAGEEMTHPEGLPRPAPGIPAAGRRVAARAWSAPHVDSAAPVGSQDATRDRFIDLVRVCSMLAVVCLHWVSVMPATDSGRITDRNVVDEVPGLWPLTWLGDVMPLFFFVGGFANWMSLQASRRRGEPVWAHLAHRLRRLVGPCVAFLGLWLAIDLAARVAGVGGASPLRHVGLGSTIPFGPLWFLGVYLIIVLLSPWTVAAHRRWGLAVPLSVVAGVVAGDLAADHWHSGTPLVANLVLVWAIPHQLGYLYADGRLRDLSAPASAALAASGLAALALLTSLPQYPRSLVTPRWTVLAFDAPMLPLVAQTAWLVGLALLLRGSAQRLLAHRTIWRRVSRLNDLTMTVYLWHMTAYLAAATALAGLGADYVYTRTATVRWWWGRPAVITASGLVLVALLALTRGIHSTCSDHGFAVCRGVGNAHDQPDRG